MSSAGRNSISSCFQHGLQDGYLSLKPHVKGGLFPLRNWDLSFWTPVNFEVEYFINEETEGVLTDYCDIFL